MIVNKKFSHSRKEGYLWKLGKKTGIIVKRYYVLIEGAMIVYTSHNSCKPHGTC